MTLLVVLRRPQNVEPGAWANMNDAKRVRLMISSRVDATARLDTPERLETLRGLLRNEIEAETLLGGPVDQFMQECRSTLREVLFDLAREGATSVGT